MTAEYDLVFKSKFTKFGYVWWKSDLDFYVSPQIMPIHSLFLKELDLLCSFLITVKPRKTILVNLSVFELARKIGFLNRTRDKDRSDLPDKYKDILFRAILWNDIKFEFNGGKFLARMLESACADLGLGVDIKESDKELKALYPKPINYKKIEEQKMKAFLARKNKRKSKRRKV